MKIRVVSSKDEIAQLDEDEKLVHLAFRPSEKDIFTLVQRCQDLQAIQIASSYMRSVSSSTKMFLSMQNIALLQGDLWGHRKDKYEYFELDAETVRQIRSKAQKGLAGEELLDEVGVKKRLGKDLIDYIVKGKPA